MADGAARQGRRGGRGVFRGRGRGGGRGGRGGRGSGRVTRYYDVEIESRPIGFQKVADLLSEQESLQILLQITDARFGFKARLDHSQPPDGDFLLNIIKVIDRAREYKSDRSITLELLVNFRKSQIVSVHLITFFTSLMSEGTYHKLQIGFEVSRLLLDIFREMLKTMNSSWKEVFPVLTIMDASFKHLEKSGKKMPTGILDMVEEVLDICKDNQIATTTKLENKTFKPAIDDQRPPPNNFREISVIPTAEDILSKETPYLRKNIVSGSFNGLEHYLDVHFRLLREDFIRPLREGIQQYLRMMTDGLKERNTDIRIYSSVRILHPICSANGVDYRIQIGVGKLNNVRWMSSKRLIFGSLLCLSRDNFKTCTFATVANKDLKLLANGKLDIRLEQNLDEINDVLLQHNLFTMAESTAFFEAYRHVLQALRDISHTLPFQRYLVYGDIKVDPPSYVVRNQAGLFHLGVLCTRSVLAASSSESDEEDRELRHTARHRGVPRNVQLLTLSTWPTAEKMNLDNTQFEALQAALTKQLAIIHGPPGTGKTFIGLKIVQALLHNKEFWNPISERIGSHDKMHALESDDMDVQNNHNSPILVVCYTNRALDQFLEGILGFCRTGIVRVGGRSRSELMNRYTLGKLRVERRGNIPLTVIHAQRDIRLQMKDLEHKIHTVSIQIASCSAGIMNEDMLEDFMQDRQYYDLVRIRDLKIPSEYRSKNRLPCIAEWLGLGGMIYMQQQHQHEDMVVEESEEEDLDIDEDADELEGQRRLDVDDDDGRHQNFQEAANVNLTFNLNVLNEQHGDENEHVVDDEWRIKKSPIQKIKQTIKQRLQETSTMSVDEQEAVENLWQLSISDRWKLYRYWVSQYKQRLRYSIQEHQNLADRLREILNEGDKHIMQEAKVLGMTTTGAARYRNMLQEVRPKIIIVEEAAQVLEAHIVTAISEACEHLILIGDHKQLRPNPIVYELAEQYKLKVSLFERMLNNGIACVTLDQQHRMRPEIANIMKHIYPNLRNHESVEAYDNVKGISKNMYFVDHKFQEDQDEKLKSKSNYHEARFISGLCGYLLLQGYSPSQITVLTAYIGQIVRLKEFMPKTQFEGVHISAIDDFQGEENDITLLSLVRSNYNNSVGFLKEDSRICVALSRAKMGLYVIGNFSVLEASSGLWQKVVKTARNQGCFGPTLQLYCQNHPEDVGLSVCHWQDFQHAPERVCKRPCRYRLPCGHACERTCHVNDTDHTQYECIKPCGKRICDVDGHKCTQTCNKPCRSCKIPVMKLLPCSHIALIKCFQNVRDVSCREMCNATLECGHSCKGSCGVECFSGRLHRRCKTPCGRILVCGHVCKDICSRECPPCNQPCEKGCVHSKCPKVCGEECIPCRKPCAWQCQHKRCTRLCSEPCDRDRCDVPCDKVLRCGHPCIGLCGEICPSKCRVCHKEEVQDIFFGTEHDEHARFVQLQDCDHIFEVSGLDAWMNTNRKDADQSVQLKSCPKCKMSIRKSLRYGSQTNDIFRDTEAVKKRVIQKSKRAKISGELRIQLRKQIKNINKTVTRHLSETGLAVRVMKELERLSAWVTDNRRSFSDQEIAESKRELQRLDFYVSLLSLNQRRLKRDTKLPADVQQNNERAVWILHREQVLSNDDLVELSQVVQKMKELVPISGLGISKEEQEMILKLGRDTGLRQGAWYKCKNGHIYAIGDCGGSTMTSRCPECREQIGGTGHRLHEVNTEMDGCLVATRTSRTSTSRAASKATTLDHVNMKRSLCCCTLM